MLDGARLGISWCRLPAAYGKGNSVYHRFAHGCARGVWPRRMAYLQAKPELSAGRRDNTVGRTPKKGGWISPSGAAGAASAPRSTAWRINGAARQAQPQGAARATTAPSTQSD